MSCKVADALNKMLVFHIVFYTHFRLLPPKLMREWTSLFVEGKPLYEQTDELPAESEEPTPEQILEMERQALLDEGDFNEYRVIIAIFLSLGTYHVYDNSFLFKILLVEICKGRWVEFSSLRYH